MFGLTGKQAIILSVCGLILAGAFYCGGVWFGTRFNGNLEKSFSLETIKKTVNYPVKAKKTEEVKTVTKTMRPVSFDNPLVLHNMPLGITLPYPREWKARSSDEPVSPEQSFDFDIVDPAESGSYKNIREINVTSHYNPQNLSVVDFLSQITLNNDKYSQSSYIRGYKDIKLADHSWNHISGYEQVNANLNNNVFYFKNDPYILEVTIASGTQNGISDEDFLNRMTLEKPDLSINRESVRYKSIFTENFVSNQDFVVYLDRIKQEGDEFWLYVKNRKTNSTKPLVRDYVAQNDGGFSQLIFVSTSTLTVSNGFGDGPSNSSWTSYFDLETGNKLISVDWDNRPFLKIDSGNSSFEIHFFARPCLEGGKAAQILGLMVGKDKYLWPKEAQTQTVVCGDERGDYEFPEFPELTVSNADVNTGLVTIKADSLTYTLNVESGVAERVK